MIHSHSKNKPLLSFQPGPRPRKGGGPLKESPALALFDFDGTMLRGDSIVAYAMWAYHHGALSLSGYIQTGLTAIRYALGNIDAQTSKSQALAFRKALSEQEKAALDRSFALECLLPRVYPQARACLAQHRQDGRLTLLVTASTENYMQYVADALGFDGLLATPLNEDGSAGTNCRGEEKVRRIHAWLAKKSIQPDWAASFAWGQPRRSTHAAAVRPPRSGKPQKEAAPGRAGYACCALVMRYYHSAFG